MNVTISNSNFFSKAIVAVAALTVSISAHAGLAAPYIANADTMHLWHFQDTNGPYAIDSAPANANNGAVPITLTNYGEPTPTTFPFTNTSFGNSSGLTYPGLSSCYTGTTKQHVLYGGAYPNVSQFCNPTTGAFTFEALVNIGAAFSGADVEILCGDNGLGINNRGWQWRIYQGVIEWDLLAGGTTFDFKATLPTSGPDAVALNQWYHIAITFTGQSPTNGDTAGQLTYYWTLLDPSRTYADKLAQFTTNSSGAMMPGLVGTSGASQPSLGIGGSARSLSNPGNNEGLIGSMAEMRVTDLALTSNQMVFIAGGSFPPKFSVEPPSNTLAAYGGPLVLNTAVSATQPATNTWFLNGTPVANQPATSLNIPSATFTDGGLYVLIVSNAYGSATSTVANVTIGAAATGLYSTGLTTNGTVSTGDVPDPNYTLIQSQDLNYLGPVAEIFEWNNPIEFSPTGGGSFGPTNGSAEWIGDQGNQGGLYFNSVAGQYIYRTTFLLDQADPTAITLNATVFVNGNIGNILINGRSTGISVGSSAPLYLNAFTITTSNSLLSATVTGTTIATTMYTATNSSGWFVPGLNTLDLVENVTAGQSAIMVENPYAIGKALPAGVPVILDQPASQTVEDSSVAPAPSAASFSVVATGRSPISYQWYQNGVLLPGVTSRVLAFNSDNGNAPANGPATNYFSVVVSNSSGSVTSAVAALTVVESNVPPVCPNLNVVAFAGATATIQLSDLLVLLDLDPSGLSLTFDGADGSSTNGGTVNQVNGTLVYTPVPGYIGQDQFSYGVSDNDGGITTGYVELQNFLAPAPASQIVPPSAGIPVSYNIGVTNPPTGYSFQWQLNGANVAGATTGVLTITNPTAANSGKYSLVVTDPSAVAWASPAVMLTVEAYGPYPLPIANVFDSSEQGAYPATNAVDGNFTDFWVSYGTVAGQGPSASSPEWLFVEFPRLVSLSEILIYPRSGYGPNAIQLIVNSQLAPGTPPNGTETYGIPTNGTVIYTGTMANSAAPLDVLLQAPVNVTNIQLSVTSSFSTANVQVEEMVFNERSLPGTFGAWELGAFTSAQINNAAVSSPFADPDGDGVLNLQEFAVGGNPLVKDATNSAMAAVVLPGNQIGVSYKALNQLGDVSLQFQASPDLVTWTNVTPTAINVVSNLGATSIFQAVFPQQPPLRYYREEYGMTNVLRY